MVVERQYYPVNVVPDSTQDDKGFLNGRYLAHHFRTAPNATSLRPIAAKVYHGPSTFGLPGMYHPQPTDENYRRFFQRYAEVMEARDWDEMRVTNSAKVEAAA